MLFSMSRLPILTPLLVYAVLKKYAEYKKVIVVGHGVMIQAAAGSHHPENGEIIEQGSHEELMKKNGTYAYMFNLQAEKYQN